MKKAQKKTKIKKLHLPLKKMTDREKDYTAVLLEDMGSNMQAFLEGLSAVREKGDATFEEVGKINGELTIIKDSQILMQQDIRQINGRLNNIEREVASIKSEIKDLKMSLFKKADLDRLEVLELRVARIEKHFKLTT